MVAGIKVVNAFGSIQIDDAYINTSLISSGTTTTSEVKLSANYSVGRATVSGYPSGSLVGFYSNDYLEMLIQDPSKTETNSCLLQSSTSLVSSLEYYVFNLDKNLVGVGDLFQIKDGLGEIKFHNNMLPLRVVDVVTKNVFSGQNLASNSTYAIPNGRKYAVVPSMESSTSTSWLISSDQVEISIPTVSVRMDSNYIHFSPDYARYLILPESFGEYSPNYNARQTFIIIDVTNYLGQPQ